MRYQVLGDTMPAVEVVFDNAGESMYTQSGGMAWMSEGIAMDSNMRGGLGKSIGRMFSGESLFMATYKAERPGAMIAFASTVAGEILPVDIGACGGRILVRAGERKLEHYFYEEIVRWIFRRRGLYLAGYVRHRYGVPGD